MTDQNLIKACGLLNVMFEEVDDEHFERPRVMPIIGDHMAPTLRPGDFAAVIPCDHYYWEGLYVLDVFGAPCVYRCQSNLKGGIEIKGDNPCSATQTLPVDDFNSVVLGRVSHACKQICGDSELTPPYAVKAASH